MGALQPFAAVGAAIKFVRRVVAIVTFGWERRRPTSGHVDRSCGPDSVEDTALRVFLRNGLV